MTLAGTRIPQASLQKSVSLRSNDRNKGITDLVAHAKILAALKVEPPTADFGRLDRSAEAQTKTIKLTRGDAGPIKPEIDNVASDKNIKAQIKEIVPGQEYELSVTAAPPWPNGPLGSVVAIRTGVEESSIESIRVNAQIPPRVVARPTYLSFLANSEEEQKQVITLDWSGDAGHVTEATATDEHLKVEIEGDSPQTVSVTLPPNTALQAGRSLRLNLKLDDPTVPMLSVPVISRPTTAAPSPLHRPKSDPRS